MPLPPLAIIPVFNERNSIAAILSKIISMGFHVVVIDDCSKDDSGKIAAEAGAIVLRHPINLGYGCALQTGYMYAIRHGYLQVVQLDGDGQHDPESALILLKTLEQEKCDVVIGSRFLDHRSYQVPRIRRLGQKFFGFLLNAMTGMGITDPTSGFQALNANVLEFYCSKVFPDDFPDANILVLLYRKGFQVVEVPVRMFPSASGSMHSGFYRSIYYAIKMTFSLLMSFIMQLPPMDHHK